MDSLTFYKLATFSLIIIVIVLVVMTWGLYTRALVAEADLDRSNQMLFKEKESKLIKIK